jgi:Ca-activated chloride channel family protein
MNATYKTIVLLTILTAHSLTAISAQQLAKQTQSQLSPKIAEPVVLHVTVTDKYGRFVKGLGPSDFEVAIDKKPAHIVSVSQADLPVSVGIVFDSSGSMAGGSEKAAANNFAIWRQALRHFLAASNKSNDYFLLGFNIKPQLLVDWTSDPITLADKFDYLKLGNTALYDACYLAVDKVQHGRHAKKALILISDGEDNLSHYTFEELREFLRETDVLLYSIDFPSNLPFGRSSLGEEGVSTLYKLSSLSGGIVLSSPEGSTPGLNEATTVLETIALELRNQYTITIVPDDSITNKIWRKVKVRANPPPDADPRLKKLEARTREGFYAH